MSRASSEVQTHWLGGISLQTLLISALQPLLTSALKALLNFVRMPEIKVKVPIVNRLKEEIKRHSRPLSERVAKTAVVLVFTVGWLLIVLVRSQVANDPAATEGSSLPGLAAALQQGAISGRDFQ